MNAFCYALTIYAHFLDLPMAWPEECAIAYSGCYDGMDDDSVTVPCNFSVRFFF